MQQWRHAMRLILTSRLKHETDPGHEHITYHKGCITNKQCLYSSMHLVVRDPAETQTRCNNLSRKIKATAVDQWSQTILSAWAVGHHSFLSACGPCGQPRPSLFPRIRDLNNQCAVLRSQKGVCHAPFRQPIRFALCLCICFLFC